MTGQKISDVIHLPWLSPKAGAYVAIPSQHIWIFLFKMTIGFKIEVSNKELLIDIFENKIFAFFHNKLVYE